MITAPETVFWIVLGYAVSVVFSLVALELDKYYNNERHEPALAFLPGINIVVLCIILILGVAALLKAFIIFLFPRK